MKYLKLIAILMAIQVIVSCNSSEKKDEGATQNVPVQVETIATTKTKPLTSHEAVIPASDLKPSYDFKLKDVTTGNYVSYADFAGKVVIIDFWDTWCPPCRAEIPHFIELHNEYKDKGVAIIGVALGKQGEAAVKNFTNEYKINYPTLMADRQALNTFFNSKRYLTDVPKDSQGAIPSTFVMDKTGEIYKIYVGYQDKSVFKTDIESLLNRS